MKKKTKQVLWMAGTLLWLVIYSIGWFELGTLAGPYFKLNSLEEEGLSGMYYPTLGYYEVSTRGMTIEEIGTTDVHERCHALVNADYAHFCEHNNSSLKYQGYEELNRWTQK